MSNFDTVEDAIETLAEVYYGINYKFSNTYDYNTDKSISERWNDSSKPIMFLYYAGDFHPQNDEDDDDRQELRVKINPNMTYEENCRMYLNVLKKKIHERIQELNKVLLDCFVIEDMLNEYSASACCCKYS